LILLFIPGIYACQDESAEKILKRTLAEIEKIKTVEQILVTEFRDSSNYFMKTDTSVYYFDFRKAGAASGAKYHCPGTLIPAEASPVDCTYEFAKVVDTGYGRKAYEGSKLFYFPIFGSIDAVRRFLPSFLADSTIQIKRLNDTVFNDGREHYQIRCLLMNRCLQPGGDIALVSYAEDHLRFSYDLLIEKESRLPSVVIYNYTYLNRSNQWWKASTTRYDLTPPEPDRLWNISANPLNYISYTEEERLADAEERLRTQILNTPAVPWELPDLMDNRHSLDDFSEKLLLLEFFYMGCGNCHRSFPFLNRVKEQYDSRRFDVVGINFVQSEADQLKRYVRESGIRFLVLDNGAQTAIRYKVSAAPLILLIKDGSIIHAVEGYNEEIGAELLELIELHI